MSIEQFLGFFLFSFIAAATPGPNNVLLTAAGISIGFRRGLPTLWGIVCGISIMIMFIAWTVGGIINQIEEYSIYIKIIGATVLIRLAWQIATAPVGKSSSDSEDSKPDIGFGFFSAALFQWVNPKAWIVITAAITTYLGTNQSVFYQGLLFSVVFGVTSTIGCVPWLALGTVLGRFLEDSVRARIFNISMAILLIVSVLPALILG